MHIHTPELPLKRFATRSRAVSTALNQKFTALVQPWYGPDDGDSCYNECSNMERLPVQSESSGRPSAG